MDELYKENIDTVPWYRTRPKPEKPCSKLHIFPTYWYHEFEKTCRFMKEERQKTEDFRKWIVNILQTEDNTQVSQKESKTETAWTCKYD